MASLRRSLLMLCSSTRTQLLPYGHNTAKRSRSQRRGECCRGDTLSPFLFITVLDSVLRQTLREEGGFTVKRRRSSRHPETKLCALAYADDIAIISDTYDGADW
ncbi:hypothetical protein ACOMHN_018846 [Nucella lapillus]